MKSENPVDALAKIVRRTAKKSGLNVDEQSLKALRRYCDSPSTAKKKAFPKDLVRGQFWFDAEGVKKMRGLQKGDIIDFTQHGISTRYEIVKLGRFSPNRAKTRWSVKYVFRPC